MPPTPSNRLWIWYAAAGLGCLAWALLMGWPMLAVGGILLGLAIRNFLQTRPTQLKKREGSPDLG
jgi:hypothetical protein